MDSIFAFNIGSSQPYLYNLNSQGIVNSEFIHFFYSINIHSSDPYSFLAINNSDYEGYDTFINDGIAPKKQYNLSVSDSTASVNVQKTIDNLQFDISITNRELPLINDPNFIRGGVEIWSKTLNNNGLIPASRFVTKANFNNSSEIASGLSFLGGNPANRSYIGLLQPNGYYKAKFKINLPSANSYALMSSNGCFYYSAIISPYSVPNSPDFIS